MVSHRVCGGGVLGNNNGSMWAPGVSMVTMWEQSEEEEEQEGDDGESDLIGCNLPIFLKKNSHSLHLEKTFALTKDGKLESTTCICRLSLLVGVGLGKVPSIGLFLSLFRSIEFVTAFLYTANLLRMKVCNREY